METQARERILLVEDDPGVAQLEQRRLEQAGFAVVKAATAEEGLDRVAKDEIELIILNQRLNSRTSGLEFLRQVRESGYNLPAILVTGLNDENLLIEALRAGIRDFVPQTPSFLNLLEAIVTRVLDQVRNERDLAEARIVASEHDALRRELEREIARRKSVEQALIDADKRREQFLAMLAHDLRNPLSLISTAVQIMQLEGANGSNFRWSSEVIEKQIKQMISMLDDLLDVSRIDLQ